MDTPTLPQLEPQGPPPFPTYEVPEVGTVTAHEGAHYIVRMLDGRVCGFAAPSGTPSEEQAAADIAAAIANPQTPAPVVVLTPLQILGRLTPQEEATLATSTDLAVQVVRTRLIAASEIRSDDPRTAEGRAILVAKGIITAERAVEIFA